MDPLPSARRTATLGLRGALLIAGLVVAADQVLKVWVKLTMLYDTAFPLIPGWDKAYIHFIENRGMAFGLEFGGEWGKLALTLFRIAAVFGIGWYLRSITREGAPRLLVISVALVLAGALGNIIDSTFYGLLFSRSTFTERAVFLPAEGGYAPLFHGAVVDMFYFPLYDDRLPEWVPIWGGRHVTFFRPVFNIADAAITVGIALYILMQRGGRRKEQASTEGSSEAAIPMTEADPATDPAS